MGFYRSVSGHFAMHQLEGRLVVAREIVAGMIVTGVFRQQSIDDS
jgi:hypothetical protein